MSDTNNQDEFTIVPILEAFDSEKVIGELRILTARLPPTPAFSFSLGYQALERPETKAGEIPRTQYLGPYKLTAVAPIADQNLIGYYRQVGLLPAA